MPTPSTAKRSLKNCSNAALTLFFCHASWQICSAAGEGTDFFEEVGIVRYRSRRDLLEMATSPTFQAAEPHKWASMEKTVVVPTRKLILLDPTIVVPSLLLLIATIGKIFN